MKRRHVIKRMHLRRAQAVTEIEYDHISHIFVLITVRNLVAPTRFGDYRSWFSTRKMLHIDT
jgi:hypothetical protein